LRAKKQLLLMLIYGFSLFGITVPAQAEAPLGDYRCVGNNPGQQTPYKGNVHIKKSGQTYIVLWRFGATTYIGTGIEQGDAFAVAFTKTQDDFFGLLLLRKNPKNGHWTGIWTQPGSTIVGKEIWAK
jgi:hypothetical protein